MNKNLILSGIAVTAFLISGCGKKEDPLSTTFESEEMAEDMNSTLNEAALAPQDAIPENNANISQASAMLLETASVYDPTQPYVKPTDEEVQQSLKNAGVYSGKVDGVVGPRTKKAIRDFQAQHDLNSDGRIGPQTWAKLGPYLYPTPDAAVAPSAVSDDIGN